MIQKRGPAQYRVRIRRGNGSQKTLTARQPGSTMSAAQSVRVSAAREDPNQQPKPRARSDV